MDEQTSDLPSIEESLLAIAALLVEDRDARLANDSSAPKVEVMLANSGLSPNAIASMTGKNEPAVRMTISRAGTAPKATKRTKAKSSGAGKS